VPRTERTPEPSGAIRVLVRIRIRIRIRIRVREFRPPKSRSRRNRLFRILFFLLLFTVGGALTNVKTKHTKKSKSRCRKTITADAEEKICLECKTKFGKYFKRSQCLFIRFWSGVKGLSQASIAQPSVRLLPVDVLSKGSFIDKATRTQTQWASTHTHTLEESSLTT